VGVLERRKPLRRGASWLSEDSGAKTLLRVSQIFPAQHQNRKFFHAATGAFSWSK
jgi:hypothetical protein